MPVSRFGTAFSLLVIISIILSACAAAPAPQVIPPTQAAPNVVQLVRPAFDSTCPLENEGKLAPTDKNPQRDLRIAVLGLYNSDYWLPVREGVQDAGKELSSRGVSVTWIVPGEEATAETFGVEIESLVRRGLNAIITVGGDERLVPFINKAVDAGIPVATIESESASSNGRLFYIGADLQAEGIQAADTMAAAVDGKGKIAIVTTNLTVESNNAIRRAFEGRLLQEFPLISVVGAAESRDKAEVAQQVTAQFIAQDPDLVGVLVISPEVDGVLRAIDAAGMTGKIKVITFGLSNNVLDAIKSGGLTATFGHTSYALGHDSVIRMYNFLTNGEMPPCGRMLTTAEKVTAENVDQYLK